MTAKNPQILQIFLFVLISSLFCPFTSGKIIYVNNNVGQADFQTIQAAIDDANDGDTVLVAPGTYTGDGNRDIDFKGKAITVKSKDGYDTCIINCKGSEEEPHRGFFFHNGEDANSILQGFTIINGYEDEGGGIFCNTSSPLITDCLITANTALGTGGGIHCADSNFSMIRCIIRNNVANSGGGICIGSAFYSDWQSSSLTLINCFITGNQAIGLFGGGILCRGKVTLSNCTVFGNRAVVEGGGIYFEIQGRKISNSILYGNMALRASEIAQGPHGAAGCRPELIIITHSIVGSDSNAIDFPHCYNGEWLHTDPLFAQPGYWDPNGIIDDPNDDFWVEGDYHLKSQAGRWDPNSGSWVIDDITSPCIDAGDPNSPVAFEPFPNGGIINMGAYGGTSEASKSPSGLHSKYGGGTGEPNTPYLIYTAQHLNIIGAEPNDWDKYFKLMADIDLSSYLYDCAPIAPDTNNTEIGFQGISFTGVFDGNGHTISQISITGASYLGLFGQMESGVQIRNLGVVDVNITGSGDYFGALAGFSRGNITTSYCTGTVSGDRFVGGLTGRNWGKITTSYNVCAVAGNEDAGGIAAGNYGSITNSYSTGAVIANRGVGGLVGENYGSIATCYSTGPVNGDQRAGGLVGYNWQDADVTASFWDVETSGLPTSAGGTGKTTTEMQTASTFLEAGWDFVDETENGAEDIWWIPESSEYPKLWWEFP
jgi:predicted outer membrane repeat protein